MAGSTGTDEIRMFNLDKKNYECMDIMRNGIGGGVYQIEFSNYKCQASYGTSAGKWGIIEYK